MHSFVRFSMGTNSSMICRITCITNRINLRVLRLPRQLSGPHFSYKKHIIMYLVGDSFSPGEAAYFRVMEQEHDDFTERLRKTLYYGQLPSTDRPSLPLTDLAVRYYQEAAPKELGRLDHYWAASTARAACMSPSSMVAGMMYVKRLRKRKSEYLSRISSSELFLISVMMASKFLYDEGIEEEVFNDEWATSGNLDTEDVNELEREFLSAIDWELFVQPEDFKDALGRIEKRIALEQGLDRGWFSYTDLEILLRDFSLLNQCDLHVKELVQVIGISAVAYIASVLTMVSSTILATTMSSALVHFGFTTLSNVPKLLPVTAPIQSLKVEITDDLRTSEDLELLMDGSGQGVYCNKTKENKAGVVADGRDKQETSALLNDNHDTRVHNNLGTKYEDNGQYLSGFLSHFLVLLTLKDTIMKFGHTLLEQETGIKEDIGADMENDRVCSDGPCLMDSWPNCWNLSSGHDWSAYKSQQSKLSAKLSNGHSGSKQYTGQNGQVSITVCCCKSAAPGTILRHRLRYRYVDNFSVGFSTSSAIPILVT